MTWRAAIDTLAGPALAAWLPVSRGLGAAPGLVRQADLGRLPVVPFHLAQVLSSALAWRAVAGPMRPQPSLRGHVALRWIREGVNILPPVAQTGGEVAAARLLRRRGVPLTAAGTEAAAVVALAGLRLRRLARA